MYENFALFLYSGMMKVYSLKIIKIEFSFVPILDSKNIFKVNMNYVNPSVEHLSFTSVRVQGEGDLHPFP